jgi:hypothetical protein
MAHTPKWLNLTRLDLNVICLLQNVPLFREPVTVSSFCETFDFPCFENVSRNKRKILRNSCSFSLFRYFTKQQYTILSKNLRGATYSTRF